MKKYFNSSVGRLRLLGFLEGTSLLLLVLIAVPMKYWMDDHSLVKSIGPVHGALFLLFVFNALQVGVEQKWKFMGTTMKVLIACPFGTFYIDKKILKAIHVNELH